MLLRTRVGLAIVFVAACDGKLIAAQSDGSDGSDGRDEGFPIAIEDAGSSACTPLDPDPVSARVLEASFAVGRANDGTTYALVGSDAADLRAFVSNGSVLEEQAILNRSGVGSTLLAITLADRQIEVETAGVNGPAVRMGVRLGPPGATTFDLSAAGVALTLVSGAALGGFTISNSQAMESIVYDAFTKDGQLIVVLGPANTPSVASDDDYRVFFGATAGADNMVREQHATVSVAIGMTVSFTTNGTSYVAYLPSKDSPRSLGGPTLTAGGTASPLTYAFPPLEFTIPDNGIPFALTVVGTDNVIAPTFLCF